MAHRTLKLDHVVQVSQETEPMWMLSVAVGKGNGGENGFMWLYVVSHTISFISALVGS